MGDRGKLAQDPKDEPARELLDQTLPVMPPYNQLKRATQETAMTIEQAILTTVRSLPLAKQQEVLDFADFLASKQNSAALPEGTFYGCIEDPTFIRQPQGMQPERESLA